MTDWIAIGLSAAALVVSGLAYWGGLPRLKVKATETAIIVNAPDDWAGPIPVGIRVTLVNDGGAAASIDGVFLSGENIFGPIKNGPTNFPMKIEARGGSASWLFDANAIRARLGEKIQSELRDPKAPLLVRATVKYGGKMKRSGSVQINAPGDVRTRPPTRRQRVRRYVRSWTSPTPFIAMWHRVSLEDVEARIVRLEIVNNGRGKTRPYQLVVMVDHADNSREWVQRFPPIDVPRIRGRSSIELPVTYVDDSNASPGDQFWWALRDESGVTGQMTGANRISEVPALMARLKQRESGGEN